MGWTSKVKLEHYTFQMRGALHQFPTNRLGSLMGRKGMI